MRHVSTRQIRSALHELVQTEEFRDFVETSEEGIAIEEEFNGVMESLDEMDEITVHFPDPIPQDELADIEAEFAAEMEEEDLDEVYDY